MNNIKNANTVEELVYEVERAMESIGCGFYGDFQAAMEWFSGVPAAVEILTVAIDRLNQIV